jgi:hypothetical protein
MKILKITIMIFLVLFFTKVLFGEYVENISISSKNTPWSVISIDTMKFSRDLARQTLTDRELQDDIKKQVRAIASTGATHVAIGTPYDNEFLPVLKMWVKEARKNKLKVFFRGNFSGWEEWFEYEKISRKSHTARTKQFIENNKDLFVDGDIFSSCPECENGENLNRSDKKQIDSYRAFLVEEYQVTKEAFDSINKNVSSNYYSMNGDIAKLIMDKETTALFDGIVVIDHYVKDIDTLVDDVRLIARKSGGKVVLGEFGVPIPAIHGAMTDKQQAIWIEEALSRLSDMPEVVGVNYWVNIGGSTGVWRDSAHPKEAVEKITKAYRQNDN